MSTKRWIPFLLAATLCMICAAAMAEPLQLAENLAAEVREELEGGANYVFRYSYPQVDPEDPSAELINSFFQTEVRETESFRIPMSVDNYRAIGQTEDVLIEVTWEITCNDDDFFAVLVRTEEGESISYAGYTFSRNNLKPGSSVALPYLLGLLESEESDTWLQDRQTAKADDLVREMVWDSLQARDGKDLQLVDYLDEEYLEYSFFPEEDFYYTPGGVLCFYLQPGWVEDSDRLITVPISIEEILDEM